MGAAEEFFGDSETCGGWFHARRMVLKGAYSCYDFGIWYRIYKRMYLSATNRPYKAMNSADRTHVGYGVVARLYIDD